MTLSPNWEEEPKISRTDPGFQKWFADYQGRLYVQRMTDAGAIHYWSEIPEIYEIPEKYRHLVNRSRHE